MSEEIHDPLFITNPRKAANLIRDLEFKLIQIRNIVDAILASSEPFDGSMHPYRIAQQLKDILNE